MGILSQLYALNLICVFVISGAGFMFLYTFMGITFSSAFVSVSKLVFVSFTYCSVDHLFVVQCLYFLMYGVYAHTQMCSGYKGFCFCTFLRNDHACCIFCSFCYMLGTYFCYVLLSNMSSCVSS